MKTNISPEKRQKYLERMKDFTLMDDAFMTVVFQNDTEITELVLRIIMENPDLHVIEARTQDKIKNLNGKTVILDITATDNSGKLYDIEVQRTDTGANPRRARYYSSLIDGISLNSGKGTDELPDAYVIFITENDVLGDSLPVYHIDRTIMENGTRFDDGSHILYVNGQCRDGSPIGNLMHDFHCKNPDDMKNEVLCRKTKAFKDNEERSMKMGSVMDELIQEEKEEIITRMLKDGALDDATIARYCCVPIETVQSIQKTLLAETAK